MPINFRKSLKIAPGLRLNLGKTGVGASATIPGTGVSATTRRRKSGGARTSAPGLQATMVSDGAPQSAGSGVGRWLLYFVAVIFSPAAAWLARGRAHGLGNAAVWLLGLITASSVGTLFFLIAIAHAVWTVWSRPKPLEA